MISCMDSTISPKASCIFTVAAFCNVIVNSSADTVESSNAAFNSSLLVLKPLTVVPTIDALLLRSWTAAACFAAAVAASSCAFTCSSYSCLRLLEPIRPATPPTPAPIRAPAAVPRTGTTEPIAAPVAAPRATPPTFKAPDSSSIVFRCLSVSFVAFARSIIPDIPVPAPIAPPAIAPSPMPARAPVPREAPPARLPAPRLIAVMAPFPRTPAPVADEPITKEVNEEPPPVGFPNKALPMPPPMLKTGAAILYSKYPDIAVSSPAASPPGRIFPTSCSMPDIAALKAVLIVSLSKPAAKPSANERPMLTPSSAPWDMSMPSRARSPTFNAVPMPEPTSPATDAIFSLPVLSHHSRNGSAIISSHRILTLPKKSASWKSAPPVISASLSLKLSAFSSNQSMKSDIDCSTSGICAVIQSANVRRYGASLEPSDNLASSTAL